MPAEAFFRLRNVHKVYQTGLVETTALADVSLDIREGEFVCVMGPSGCGKTTLLQVMGLLMKPTSGRIRICGEDVTSMGEDRLPGLRLKHIGFIFQDFMLLEDLSVYENVELPLHALNVSRHKRQARVREVLELLDLQRRAKHRPLQLSGGQQQRVAIARAVVGDPKLIVADEPTGNLDSHHGEEVMDMLTTLNQQGTTVLMVTHSPAHAGRASRILTMLDGRLMSDSARVTA